MANKVRKLTGIEIVPQAIENAKKNALQNNINNADFFCGGAEIISDILNKNNDSPDVIILDPPRKGCDINTISAAVKAAPERIVMISCNPATAARDCKLFDGLGYSAVKVCGVDLFPRTGHVECVVLLTRNN